MTQRRGDRGQQFDTAMRTLVEATPSAAFRVLGLPPPETVEVGPASFPSSTLTVDLLLRTAPDRLVHVEYQHVGEPDFVSRMLVYRGLIQRAHPGTRLSQHVIVLKDRRITGHDDLATNGFVLDLQVLYLRDLDPEYLLSDPDLAQLAALGRGTRSDRVQVYVRAMRTIDAAGGPLRRQRLELATILATIRLDRLTMMETLKGAGMAESIGMEILREAAEEYFQEKGHAQGLAEGRMEGRIAMLAELLRTRFGDQPEVDDVARRLAGRSSAEALQSVMAASSLDHLVSAKR